MHAGLATITHVGVAAVLVGLVVLRVFEQDFVDVSARVLEQLVVVVENDQRDFTVAQDGQLHGLLHQTILALGEGDLAIALICDAGDFDLLRLCTEALLQHSRFDALDALLTHSSCGVSLEEECAQFGR